MIEWIIIVAVLLILWLLVTNKSKTIEGYNHFVYLDDFAFPYIRPNQKMTYDLRDAIPVGYFMDFHENSNYE